MLGWQFFEQYSHEPYVAVCRFHMLYEGKSTDEREAWRVERGEAALGIVYASDAAATRSGFGSTRTRSPQRAWCSAASMSPKVMKMALLGW